ncbi:ALF repeat-containing protein [Streptomyces sp. MUM 178J]|uniref:ALF repeat-containing protein n=1 Tax=Streptomyces sp. MUM 178J TaxID=2791991 RepID=UPI001F03F05E|nr:ALF repeat-containing protein [Streptomyces sp. MUM 178J]WRQ81825.1 ALF repeat-containing protein [Streptomyces sp. MUM 178J]
MTTVIALNTGALEISTATAAEQPRPGNGRGRVVAAWQAGDSGVRTAAEQALTGSDEDMRNS